MKRFTDEHALALFLLVAAAVLRFQDLSLRPFHHDEGVNGFFLTRLVREGAYAYDPGNYHGPTLYYLTLPLVAALGLSDAALRGTIAVFGTLTVALLWRFLSPFGSVLAVAAMGLFATSPGAVFFSRYFIHEMLFVAFTLSTLAFSPRREQLQRWRFVLTGISLGLLFATKETAFVSVGALVGGAVAAAWLVEKTSPLAILRDVGPFLRANAESLMQAFVAFAATAGLFYSSFLTHGKGVLDAFRTFAFWTKTAVRDHDNPWNQHFLWLAEADQVLVWLGLLGIVVALARRRSFVAVLGAVWTLLIFGAYSVVKYKTPWLGLNMLLPLAIMAGYLIQEIWNIQLLSGTLSFRAPALVLGVLCASYSATKSLDLERRKYDDESHPYLYAHTQRSFLSFVRLIKEQAAALGTGTQTGISVFAPENWPLAWYLRDYTATGYWGEFKGEVNTDMYVASVAQEGQMSGKLGDAFEKFGPYNMRGAVELVLYVKKKPPAR